MLIATSGSAALATTTRYPIVSQATGQASVTVPGTMTQHGSWTMFLGVTAEQTQISSSPYGAYVAGPQTNFYNFIVNQTKGSGFWWGRCTHWPIAHRHGTWECLWTGAMRNGVWTGKGVCHGTGELRGWQWRTDLSMDQYGILHTDGYIFFPGDRQRPD
jgi:hypothetical protein